MLKRKIRRKIGRRKIRRRKIGRRKNGALLKGKIRRDGKRDELKVIYEKH